MVVKVCSAQDSDTNPVQLTEAEGIALAIRYHSCFGKWVLIFNSDICTKRSATQECEREFGLLFEALHTANAAEPVESKPLTTESILDKHGVPRWHELTECTSCGSCYTDLDIKRMLAYQTDRGRMPPVHKDGPQKDALPCLYVPFPGQPQLDPAVVSPEPTVCGNQLFSAHTERPHGRVQKVFKPRALSLYGSLREWFITWAASMSADALHVAADGWRTRDNQPRPGRMRDIYDGSKWKSFWANDSVEQHFGDDHQLVNKHFERSNGFLCVIFLIGLHFDFVSPFFKSPRSSKATKGLKIGLIHIILLNLPWVQRSNYNNICTSSIIADEPMQTINGHTAFLAHELEVVLAAQCSACATSETHTTQVLAWDGIYVRTADSKYVRVLVRLFVTSADSPGRRYVSPTSWHDTANSSGSKLLGTPFHSARNGCPKCKLRGACVFPVAYDCL
jgi:hypothetical protein